MLPFDASLGWFGWFCVGGGISMVLSGFILLEDPDDEKIMLFGGLPLWLIGSIILMVLS